MAEKRKDSEIQKTWFGYTLKQEEEARTGGLQPSMEGKGYDVVTIERDDVFGDFERGGHPGFETVNIKDIPMYLLDKFRYASEHGHLARTYTTRIKELKRVGAIDERVYGAFEKFRPQVEQATHYSDQTKLFKESIEPYIGRLLKKKI